MRRTVTRRYSRGSYFTDFSRKYTARSRPLLDGSTCSRYRSRLKGDRAVHGVLQVFLLSKNSFSYMAYSLLIAVMLQENAVHARL